MAGKSPKTNLQADKTGWQLSASDTQENWKKDFIEIIFDLYGVHHGRGAGDHWRGCAKLTQKLKWLLFLLSSIQCMGFFFLIRANEKISYRKLFALRRWTKETISSWIWKKLGSSLACLYDIVKPFSITFLCVIAALFEHSGIFHLTWWWFKACMHSTYNMNHCSFTTGFTFKIRLLWFSLLLWLKVI